MNILMREGNEDGENVASEVNKGSWEKLPSGANAKIWRFGRYTTRVDADRATRSNETAVDKPRERSPSDTMWSSSSFTGQRESTAASIPGLFRVS